MLIDTKIPVSYILTKIRFEIAYVLVIGLLVHYLTSVFSAMLPVMPIAIPLFIGTSISIILSFKLNQSYDRWWEARKVWGSIVNDSRSFVMQLQLFMLPKHRHEIRDIAYRHIAWCYCLGQSLRGLDPLQNMDQFISEKDLNTIKKHNNKPLALLQQNTRQLAALRENEAIDAFSLVQVNTSMVNFSNAMGMAERIKTTVFPVTYRLFLHFFIYIFVVTLSIALRDIKSYFEIPLLLIISSIFFLLEKSAAHLQDPFNNRPTDTAMTTIARTVEINVKQLLDDEEVPKPITPQSFYIL